MIARDTKMRVTYVGPDGNGFARRLSELLAARVSDGDSAIFTDAFHLRYSKKDCFCDLLHEFTAFGRAPKVFLFCQKEISDPRIGALPFSCSSDELADFARRCDGRASREAALAAAVRFAVVDFNARAHRLPDFWNLFDECRNDPRRLLRENIYAHWLKPVGKAMLCATDWTGGLLELRNVLAAITAAAGAENGTQLGVQIAALEKAVRCVVDQPGAGAWAC